MSKYAVGIYGLSKYGEQEVSRTYYSTTLSAYVSGYNSVFLSWGSISPDPADVALGFNLTDWALVKSYAGAPDTPYNGSIIAGDVFNSFRNTYSDTSVATDNIQTNYSLWVFNSAQWIFCGDVNIVVPQATNTFDLISKWIPRAWLDNSYNIGESLGEADPLNNLSEVLLAYAVTYDQLRAEANILEKTSSQSAIHSGLLPAQMDTLGFNYEAALGDGYHRSLYRAGNIINGLKGTTPAVNAYVTSLTHLDNKVVIGHNRMLDYNDSSFEESVGRWVTSAGTFTQHLYVNSLTDLSSTVTSPSLPLYDFSYPPRMQGFAALALPASTNSAVLSLPGSSTSVINYGIPVQPNTRYLFSGWFKHLDNPATVAAAISWYDFNSNLLSTTALPAAKTSTTTWTEFTSKSDSGRNGQLSPLKAQYATISITVTPTTTSATTCLFDLFQMAEAVDSLEYEDARKVIVYLRGEKENWITNPDFEQGVGGWTASLNCSFAQDPTVYNTAIFYGSCLGELTVQSPGTSFITSDWFEVEPGQNYTFSAYVTSEYPNAGRAIARIEFSNRESVDKQTAILTDADGQYYDNTVYYVDGTAVTMVANSVDDGTGHPIVDTLVPQYSAGTGPDTYNGYPIQYVPVQSRVTVSAIAPQYTRDSGMPLAKLTIYYPDMIPGQTTWVDGVLFENSANLDPFFDGSGAPVPSNPLASRFYSLNDCTWEYKNLSNYVQNPSFELVSSGTTPSSWVAASGTTLVRDPGPGVSASRAVEPNGTYANAVIAPVFYNALYGTYLGKVEYDPAVGGSISTVVTLPQPAVGGEDVVVSASVRAAEGTYTIKADNGSGNSASTDMEVYQHDQYQWIRTHTVYQLVAGQTSFTLSIGIVPPAPFLPGGGPGYTIAPTSFFHIDGVQAEYGRVPNAFVNPSSNTTGTIVNPTDGTSLIYTTQAQSTNGGKSSYISNLTIKTQRLRDSLSLVMPIGSTWAVRVGYPTDNYPDLTESLIPSASFEKDLGQWVGVNSSLKRVVSNGSLYGQYVTHGAAYCLVSRTGSTGSFGIKTSYVANVLSGRGYYASAAIRPLNSVSEGSYTMRVDFYDANQVLIPVYHWSNGIISTSLPSSSGVTYTDVTTTYRTVTVTNTHTDRWGYIANIFPATSTVGAAYAILSVTFNPATPDATQAFEIDRVVFRQ